MIIQDALYHEMARDRLIRPFDPALVNPASIDLRLGSEFVTLDGTRHEKTYTLKPGEFILCHTLEHVTVPNGCAAMVLLKSSAARRGLNHALAGWVDPGWKGQLTLEFCNWSPRPIELKEGDRVVQIVYMRCNGPSLHPYQGRYQNAKGVQLELPFPKEDENGEVGHAAKKPTRKP